MHRIVRHIAAGLALALTGCGGDERAESGQPVSGESPWTLDTLAFVASRTADGAEVDFTRIRGLVRLTTGATAVVDAGVSQVVMLDDRLRFVKAVGRRGDGPGDYNMLMGIGACAGDSLAVFQPGRVTVLDPEGKFVRTITVQGSEGPLEEPMTVDDAVCDRVLWLKREALPIDTSGWLDQRYTLTWRQAAVERPLVSFTGQSRFRTMLNGSPAMVMVPWRSHTTMTARGSSVLVSSADGRAVQVFRGDAARDTATWALRGREITTADWTFYDSTRAQWIREEPRYANSLFPSSSLPARPREKAAVAEFLLADDGQVWVRSFPENTDGLDAMAPRTGVDHESWSVMRTGVQVPVAQVKVPVAFRPQQIGADTVWGIWTAASGEESIRGLPIRRTTPVTVR